MFKIFGTYICWINTENATLEVSGAVLPLYGLLGVKGLMMTSILKPLVICFSHTKGATGGKCSFLCIIMASASQLIQWLVKITVFINRSFPVSLSVSVCSFVLKLYEVNSICTCAYLEAVWIGFPKISVFISEWHVLSVPLLLLPLKALFFSYYENLQDILQ